MSYLQTFSHTLEIEIEIAIAIAIDIDIDIVCFNTVTAILQIVVIHFFRSIYITSYITTSYTTFFSVFYFRCANTLIP